MLWLILIWPVKVLVLVSLDCHCQLYFSGCWQWAEVIMAGEQVIGLEREEATHP